MDRVTAQIKFEQSCFYCGGPCFGEPTCAACHQFLFSDDWHYTQFQSNLLSFQYPCYMASYSDDTTEEQNFAMVLTNANGKKVQQDYQLSLTPIQNSLNKIPPEIMKFIFQQLDHVSLLMVSKVNTMWESVALDVLPGEQWQSFVEQRWPLFQPKFDIHDWHSVCSDLIDSVTCKRCFIDLKWNPNGTPGPDRSLRSVRLATEIQRLKEEPPFGIQAIPIDKLNFNWVARIEGPPQSAYDGGVFYLNLKVPLGYPIKPPIVRFSTKIFHPNVSRHGDIGMDITGHKWTIATTIVQILLGVQNLLENPFVEISMEPEIADLYKSDKLEFERTAAEWTKKYAMHETNSY